MNDRNMRNLLGLVVFLLHHSIVWTKETTVSLDFVGDIHLGGVVRYQNKHGYCTYNETFHHVAKYLRESDLAVGNLEAPFITKDMEKDEQKEFIPRLRADSSGAESLKYAGFDIMTLANNHLNDFKEKPINYTVNVLKSVGIKSFGYTFGPSDENRPQVPVVVKVKGIKIGFLGYCDVFSQQGPKIFHYACVVRRGKLNAGPALYSDEVATRDVNALKDKVDVIVVVMHWGTEQSIFRREGQLRHYLHLKKIGVHLIIGGHPHVLQAHTVDKRTFTAFSLGNFVFGPTKLGLDLVGDFYYNRDPSPKVFTKLMRYIEKHPTNPTLNSRLLRIYVNKKGFVSAKYLPLKIGFDQSSGQHRCYHPHPIKPARWIIVCSKQDKNCVKFNNSGKKKRKNDPLLSTVSLRDL